jgi:hypothetical protein
MGHLKGWSLPVRIAASVSSASFRTSSGHVLVGRHHHHAGVEPAPDVAGLPAAVERGFDARDVVADQSSMIAVSCAFGAKRSMSVACPNPIFPRASAV